jgi:hypothetical protein
VRQFELLLLREHDQQVLFTWSGSKIPSNKGWHAQVRTQVCVCVCSWCVWLGVVPAAAALCCCVLDAAAAAVVVCGAAATPLGLAAAAAGRLLRRPQRTSHTHQRAATCRATVTHLTLCWQLTLESWPYFPNTHEILVHLAVTL